MMKRIKKAFAALLALCLLFGLSATAQAKEVEIKGQGLKLEVPDNFEIAMQQDGDTASVLTFRATGDDAVLYIFSMGEDEPYAGRWMTDFTQEELDKLFATYSADMANPSYTVEEDEGQRWMLMRDELNREAIYMTILFGYQCEISALRVDGEALTEEQIAPLKQMIGTLAVSLPDESFPATQG